MMSSTKFDVIIIGGGISGINAGYRVQSELLNHSYAILEGRHEMGGTWSLFKYPGIRSDSDLHTFGFPWDPWNESKPIADGPSILRYLRTVTKRHGIDKHFKYNHKVLNLDWISEEQRWKIEVLVNDLERKVFKARFVVMGTGYYDYNEGLKSDIPGINNFKGQTIHPQFWPDHLDYADKKVVIIGSGATAVTLLPNMSEKAQHVTMLQRSPGYFIKIPQSQPITKICRALFPARIAHQLVRFWFIYVMTMYNFLCHYFPKATRALIRRRIRRELPPDVPLDPNFNPSYMPGEQRTCFTPDGDFFEALRSRKASVVTDTIEEVTENGILLKSGNKLDADIIITATGLKVRLNGGAMANLDGKPINIKEKFVWRSTLLQDTPNLAFIFGYTNLSWTLGSDTTARLFVRLVKQAEAQGMDSFKPVVPEGEDVKAVDLVGLNSSYIKAAEDGGVLPRAGSTAPWLPRWGYAHDWYFAKYGDISRGLEFDKVKA